MGLGPSSGPPSHGPGQPPSGHGQTPPGGPPGQGTFELISCQKNHSFDLGSYINGVVNGPPSADRAKQPYQNGPSSNGPISQAMAAERPTGPIQNG